jgi:Domain of unknown function (DUF4082)/Bacterial Ig-like domain/Bacterial Ig domain
MRAICKNTLTAVLSTFVAAARSATTKLASPLRVVAAVVLLGGLTLAGSAGHAKAAVDPCGAGGNPIACENSLPGTPQSVWDISAGDGTTIQGFADPFSVNLGGTINFKIESPASSYEIDIYRMGYYGGDGARLITSITDPSITVSQDQPTCNSNTSTGLVDCSNWGVSASWTVPTNLVSGVYFADIVRTDGTSDANQIPFVVRDDSSHSDILFETDDATWEAYNDWGGYSLYTGDATATLDRPTNLDPGRAEQVSYDRPFATRFDTPYGQDFFFYAEFPMIEFLEENGYNVSYIDQGTVASSQGASLIEQHKVLLKSGHDEYWSAPEVANVTAARNAGVNLAFFTANESYWETRWAPDAAGEANRTLITYKESVDSAVTDPEGPSVWTGEWADPRFSPPGNALPQNSLTGQIWTVNEGTSAITVPSQYAALRFWRNTAVANLQPGQSVTLAPETLGYEWDQDVDNGYRPAGEFDLSSTTVNAPQVVTDYQEDLAAETLTANLTLYRASSGALVFEAGTVQWAWGLNSNHDGDAEPAADPNMQQATINLLADMGNVQPVTLMSGLVQATESTDTTPPTSTITSPAAGATIANGSAVTVSGTATDSGGGVVAGVEISTDGGSTWHPVTSMSPAAVTVTWSYTWTATGDGPVTIETRATDDSGNIEKPSDGKTVTVNCPCGLYGANYVPEVTSSSDTSANELGVQFTSSVNGWVTGIQFYKGTGNDGTHTGTLWTSTGTVLATGTFTNETASGWQTLTFADPVQLQANTVYVAGYYAPDGHYSVDADQFYPDLTESQYLQPLYSPPLSAVRANMETGVGNGVFNAGGPGFPTSSYQGTGYGVDVIFNTTDPEGAAPVVTGSTPYPGSSSNPVTTTPTVTFSESMVPSSSALTVTDANGTVTGTTSWNSSDTVATFQPSSSLPADTTVTVTASGVQDQWGRTAPAASYTFITAQPTLPSGTCPCNIWSDLTVPPTVDAGDASAVELGVKFTPSIDGDIDGIRFYKSLANTGTHTGTLWSATGTKLATGTFTNESTEGWEQLNFATPVAVTAGTTYVASYYAPDGNYSIGSGGLSTAVTNGPLTALASGASSGSSGNGVYLYGEDAFPTNSYNSSNYYVDVVFGPNTTPPQVTTDYPISGQTSVPPTSAVTFTFNEGVQSSSIQFALTNSNGNSVPGSLTYNSSTETATFTPTSALSNAVTYTATVSSATDSNGGGMTAPYSWSFTTAQPTPAAGQCACSIWPDSTLPGTVDVNDSNSVNLGVRFTASTNGYITGIRFYKGPLNAGTHIGSLWSSSGSLLGQVTFTNESTAGWEQANFATPIAVTAGTTYVASYLAPAGEYACASEGLSTAVTNSPLTALASGGVYAYGTSSAFPDNTYNASNYWVDVVFSTTA